MIYGKLYNISWFVNQKGLQFIVWFYSLRICILTSILRITIHTNNYNSVWINKAYYFILHINQSSCLLESYVHFNQLEVELGSYIPKANVLRLQSIAVRYLAGKLHHANACRLPMAFSNLIWRCKLYYICLHVNDVHLLPFATIWKVIPCIP